MVCIPIDHINSVGVCMKKTSLMTFTLVLSALLVSSSAAQEETLRESSNVIAPGLLDLAVLPGSFIPDDCGSDIIDTTKSNFLGCVAYDIKSEGVDGKDWDSEYVDALVRLGWNFAGGAANVYYLKRKDSSNNCDEYLNMVAWFLGDKKEIDKYGALDGSVIDWEKIPYVVFYFTMDDDLRCDDK